MLSGISIWLVILRPEEKRANQDLAKSVLFARQKAHAIDQMAISSLTDLQGRILYVNDKFCEISGYHREDLLGKDHRIVNSGLHSKAFFKEMWDHLQAGKYWHGQVRNKKKNGEYYWVDSYNIPIFDAEGKALQYFSVRFEITEKKHAEEALAEEQVKSIHLGRLSSLGEMASGIAHEINNPLAVINGLLAISQRKLKEENAVAAIPVVLEKLVKSQFHISRISKIIHGLREFSSSGDDEPFENFSIRRVFSTVGDLCSEKLKSLGIGFEIKSENIEIKGNLVQIEQVLVNLVNNAIDAVSKMESPWIHLVAEKKGELLEISITDSGPGIPPHIAEKIMNPFFTTKEVGKGTGLGLSISRGIVERHGGTLSLDAKSKNTRFVILLPAGQQLKD